MKRYRIIVAIAVAIMAAGCGSDAPTRPTPPAPVISACQANNTADVSFGNRTTTGATYDLLIDNVNRGIIAPTQTIGPFTLAAGVSHTIVARLTNTSLIVCSSTPALAQCSVETLTCSR